MQHFSEQLTIKAVMKGAVALIAFVLVILLPSKMAASVGTDVGTVFPIAPVSKPVPLVVTVYETSPAGANLSVKGTLTPQQTRQKGQKTSVKSQSERLLLLLNPEKTFQHYYGFGASFTESSAWNLATIPAAKRRDVLTRLFHPTKGAGFTLTRTHINSSDYANGHYTYVADGDESLASFSIAEDMKGFTGDENDQVRGIKLEEPTYDLIPMIKEAQSIEGADFKIIASPWSPPSWMKTGETAPMTNGHLKPEYHGLWARYLSMYLTAYKDQGIDIWGLTPQNEPLHAHDARWDSNGWTGLEARDFLKNHLGPQLEKDGHLTTDDLEAGVRVLIFDHNKGDMNAYVAPTYSDPEAAQYAWGTAFHWYAPSQQKANNWYARELDKLRRSWPEKAMIHTESSIDIDPADPIGQYWRESTDYAGSFVPFSTYVHDIISNLNHGTQGYIEWCMILSHEGKPNPYDNFNSAPVLINPETDEVIYTPLYYLLSHFSKFIRPGAKRIQLDADSVSSEADRSPPLLYTAARNPDGSLAVVLFNTTEQVQQATLTLWGYDYGVKIAAGALQTLHFKPSGK